MSELALDPTPTTPESQKAQQQRTANRLTLTQTFALGTWIQDHRAIAADKPDTVGADHASIDLGFTITAANFGNARQALGIHKAAPPKPPTIEERLAALEQRCTDLEQQNRRNWEGAGDDIKALEERLNALEERHVAIDRLPIQLNQPAMPPSSDTPEA